MEIGQSSKTRRSGGGRNKTQMKLFEREEHRLITFSKRKAGINKKATELSIMCNAQIALILFSPKGNAFAFGHPELKSVVNKFLGRAEHPINGDPRFIKLFELHKKQRNEGLVEYHNMLQCELNQLNNRKDLMKQMAANRGDRKGWWEAAEKVEDMKTRQQVETLFEKIEVFQETLCHHMEMLQFIRQAVVPPVIGVGGGGYTSSQIGNGGLSDCQLF